MTYDETREAYEIYELVESKYKLSSTMKRRLRQFSIQELRELRVFIDRGPDTMFLPGLAQ
jgi:hypothetical protein|tara:strand:- start:334 stop:513 length:180 start_codon:yes stop_codon:yes gene_type:complete